jgi:hypothetical protein
VRDDRQPVEIARQLDRAEVGVMLAGARECGLHRHGDHRRWIAISGSNPFMCSKEKQP